MTPKILTPFMADQEEAEQGDDTLRTVAPDAVSEAPKEDLPQYVQEQDLALLNTLQKNLEEVKEEFARADARMAAAMIALDVVRARVYESYKIGPRDELRSSSGKIVRNAKR